MRTTNPRRLRGGAVLALLSTLTVLTMALPVGAATGKAPKPAPSDEAPVVIYLPVPLTASEAREIETGTLDLAALLKRVALAGCSGGSCATNGNTALSCPTSGGPTCGSGTSCSCICASGPGGSWAAINKCEAD